ncbi:MAG: Rne/Rng family ribonuclease [Chlorobi bacterium]|nr:Rne/Rng family ribonuclease [Chlorobiota bacterium]
MKREIIINQAEMQSRIAIMEDGKLSELFLESVGKERMVGDIYLGRVAKVLHGIRAAFIDIGLEQDAFLHFSDLDDAFKQFSAITGDDSDSGIEEVDEGENGGGSSRRRKSKRNRHSYAQVNLQKGQELLVQVVKEAYANKGVRVTNQIALPGRFLVLLPYETTIGVSRKISSFKEKRRLRRIARSIIPSNVGLIIRTVAEGKEEEVLRNDLLELLDTWKDIERKLKKAEAPTLMYKDMNTTASVMRDLFKSDVTRVVTDSKRMYREIRSYVSSVAPSMVNAVELYKDKVPIFDAFGVEKEIRNSLSRKVWLKSGGYIIIEHTEAMKVIDVNSGRFAAKRHQEENSLRTNLEAVREIARQIRLRDLGGIIIIDFIDMEQESSRRKVYEEMRREMRIDRAKSTILPLTEFCLMQITRQRIRDSVQFSVLEPCPTCDGTGLVQSKASLVMQIERWLKRFRTETSELRLILQVHPTAAEYLQEGKFNRLMKLMLKHFVRIKLQSDPSVQVGSFRFLSGRTGKDLTSKYLL